jgi:hypothetical protein
MVKKAGKLFECEECGFAYDSEKFARECEKFCGEHGACNPELTKHAVRR